MTCIVQKGICASAPPCSVCPCLPEGPRSMRHFTKDSIIIVISLSSSGSVWTSFAAVDGRDCRTSSHSYIPSTRTRTAAGEGRQRDRDRSAQNNVASSVVPCTCGDTITAPCKRNHDRVVGGNGTTVCVIPHFRVPGNIPGGDRSTRIYYS